MKRVRRLGLLLGPLMVVLMLANIVAGLTPVQAARSTGIAIAQTSANAAEVCPTTSAAITSLSVQITRGGNTINSANLSAVQPGDTVKVTFDLDDACTNYRVSLASYKAPDASNNLDSLAQRVLSSQQSSLFGATGGSLTVTVPNCYHATILAVGTVLTSMNASTTYGSRQKDTVTGGSSTCSGVSAPTPTYFTNGNQTCSSLAALYGETWEEYTVTGIPANGSYTLAGGNTLTISGSNAADTFSWGTSGLALKGVYIKSNAGGNLYRYGSGSYSGSNLKSVGKPDGTMYGIASVSFCHAPVSSQAVCPSGIASVTAYRFEIWRGGTLVYTGDNLSTLQQDDLIKVFFDLAEGCEDIRLSFPMYEAPLSYYDVNVVDQQRYIAFSGDTGVFSATDSISSRVLSTKAPSCNYQINFVLGSIITNMTPSNLYGSNKIAWKSGGSNICSWAVTPSASVSATSTSTPNATSTFRAGQTTTAIARTATTGALLTSTAVVKTQTAVARLTQTASAPTETATSPATATKTNTAIPPTATKTNTAVPATATNTPTNTVVPATATPPGQTYLTIYCGISSSDPNIRQLSVVAQNLGTGYPTMTYTLYTLDPEVLVNPQPAVTNNVYAKNFLGNYARLRVAALYPDGVTASAESYCLPSENPTATSTATNTAVPPTATKTNTVAPTATKTATPAPPTATKTNTPVPPTATKTNTPKPPTATKTNTPIPPTATKTPTLGPPTATPTKTNTPKPPTATKTFTPAPPTATKTNTPVPPTATKTNTPKPPTNTPTKTATPSPTKTNTPKPPTNTPTKTATLGPPTATPTKTNTPLPPTATKTFTPAPPTATKTATPTLGPPTATKTNTPVPPTATKTNTPLPPTATKTATPVPPTATKTNTPVPPTATATKTPVPPTATFTATATYTSTPSLPEFTLVISCTIGSDPNYRIIGVLADARGMGAPTMTYTLYGLDPNTPLPGAQQPPVTTTVWQQTFEGGYSRLQVRAVYPDGGTALANALCIPAPTPTPTMTSVATATKTSTPVPPTATATKTSTATITPPTATATATTVPGRLRIHKEDAITHERLEGACFTVVGGSFNGTVCDGGSGDSEPNAGSVAIHGLVPGVYTIIEVTAPNDYVLDSTPHTITVKPGDQGATPITINNSQIPGSLLIHKVDGDQNPLAGACFAIDGPGYDGTLCDNGSGDANSAGGEIRLDNLVPGEYTVQETSAPAGYAIDPTVYPLYVFPGDSILAQVTIINQSSQGAILIHKTNESRAPLGGACFTIVGPGFNGVACDNAQNDANPAAGEILVVNLQPGSYTVTESQAPAGYVLSVTPNTVTVTGGLDPNELTVANSPAGELRIHKIDQDGILLGGACFTVTGPGGYDVYICDGDTGTDSDERDTNASAGEIFIAGLVPGTYVVTEVEAPEGYEGDWAPKSVSVPAGWYGEVTIVNTFGGSPGTQVFMYKLLCETDPGAVNAMDVATGHLPAGCELTPGVTFDIKDESGNILHSQVTTDENGVVSYWVDSSVQTISVYEYPETNPLAIPPNGEFEYTGLHCPCGMTEIVVVNLREH